MLEYVCTNQSARVEGLLHFVAGGEAEVLLSHFLSIWPSLLLQLRPRCPLISCYPWTGSTQVLETVYLLQLYTVHTLL